ncbi:MAG: Methyltransferase [Candidatus Nomurabacteria bacterium]|nr:Methyltransferase [Candidatus Nomurabacteria bacterium]
MKIKDQYNEIGKNYSHDNQTFFKEKGEVDFGRQFILDNLKEVESKSILDVGCGAGDDIMIYEKMKFAKVFGVDPSRLMIDQALGKIAHKENVQIGDYENLPFPDNSFDYVVGRFSLHYVENIDNAYKEVLRVLKPGGQFIAIADHPMADAFEKKRYEKNGRTYITIKLFDGTIEVTFPLHLLGEYISDYFLKSFRLIQFKEHVGSEREVTHVPNAFGITAKKI